ncbi:tetratricopeptide repeat protein [Spirochaetes bacterium]|uniref:Tetratricopeptide repeat protein n=1 Tax=Candidatus Scatousia excrementipullorum TaxID=2840936 RepID=A0A9D9DRM5_9BACT|nr:tetratricopeptide repeat protein [Candidatus Scatousia excrementipullorum]
MDTENHDYKYYTDIGINETNKGNFDEAIEALDKAIELKPDFALAYFSKAIAFHNKLELEEAYENYTKAIEINPKMIDAYFNLAQVILARKPATDDDLKEALKNLEKAVELDEKFTDAYYYIGVIKKNLEDYKGAISALDKSIALEPNAVYSRALKKLIQQKYLK